MKIPSWLNREEIEMAIPGVAMVRLDNPARLIADAVEPNEEERRLRAIADAHVFAGQFREEMASQKQVIERLQIELAENTLALESEKRKNGVLEADQAVAFNTIQSMQLQIDEYRRFFSVSLDMKKKELLVYERFGIEPPPKKERKNGKKSTDPVAPSVDPSPSPGVSEPAGQ